MCQPPHSPDTWKEHQERCCYWNNAQAETNRGAHRHMIGYSVQWRLMSKTTSHLSLWTLQNNHSSDVVGCSSKTIWMLSFYRPFLILLKPHTLVYVCLSKDILSEIFVLWHSMGSYHGSSTYHFLFFLSSSSIPVGQLLFKPHDLLIKLLSSSENIFTAGCTAYLVHRKHHSDFDIYVADAL